MFGFYMDLKWIHRKLFKTCLFDFLHGKSLAAVEVRGIKRSQGSVSRPGLDVGRVVSPVEPSRVFHHPEQVVPDRLEAGGDVVVRHWGGSGWPHAQFFTSACFLWQKRKLICLEGKWTIYVFRKETILFHSYFYSAFNCRFFLGNEKIGCLDG